MPEDLFGDEETNKIKTDTFTECLRLEGLNAHEADVGRTDDLSVKI